MFLLQPKPTFWAPAALSVPGEADRVDIDVEFRHLTVKQSKAFFAAAGEKSDAELLGELITGWRRVDTEFSPGALEKLLDHYPHAAGELFEAYRKAALEARAKNS